MSTTPTTPIQPEQQDIDAIERMEGPLPANATVAQQAERYRLWQAQALFRLVEEGKLPRSLLDMPARNQ
jgi:hypothetical protein